MSEQQNKPMSREEREKLLEDARQKGVLNPMERETLAQKLDADFDAFLKEQLKASNSNDTQNTPATEKDIENLAEELRSHPAFMTEIDMTKPLSKETEALMAMQYDDNAESYKDEGNSNFKIKKYRWAIANYTEGIKCKSKDKEVNAVLYSNRATAHFHLGNFGSSLKDVTIARKFKPDHMKAIVRGAQCCMELKKFKEAMRWCDDGLMLNHNEAKLLEIRPKAEKSQRQLERDKRKEEAKERKETAEDRKLVQAIKERGVTLAGLNSSMGKEGKKDPLMLTSLESNHPSGAKMFLNDQGHLEWPVVFLYPEHGETDFISRFNEHANFQDHLMHMFGPLSEGVPWDIDGKYIPDNLEIYFENKELQKLFRINPTMTLATVLKNRKYVVHGGTPGFIILVKDSPFAKSFLERSDSL